MITRDEFANLVKDALANLWDPVHLQTHPLVRLLALSPTTWGTAGQSLRALLRETITSLKPPSSLSMDRPEWSRYRVLSLRYVRLLSDADARQELHVSNATFYRWQREALDAVSSILWERHQQVIESNADAATQTASASAEEIRTHAVQLASACRPEPVDLLDLVDGVAKIIRPLAAQRKVTLSMDLPPSLHKVYAEPSLLRQGILSVLVECTRLWPGSSLRLCMRLTEGEMICRVEGLPGLDHAPTELLGDGRFSLSRQLLSQCKGRIWTEEDSMHNPLLLFTASVARPRLVLVVDDDPATTGLYRRYFQHTNIVVMEAQTAEQAEVLLHQDRPDLILLDVMMPRKDGWTVLHTLRAQPETAGIPVIVCSALDQPDLALALGAKAVLTKPINPERLLQTIQAQWDREDRTGSPRPAKP